MNFVVVTASIGPDTDAVKQVPNVYAGVRYVAFVSEGVKVPPPWETIVVASTPGSECALARRIKILVHDYLPDADYTLWIDAAFQLLCDPIGLMTYMNWHVPVMAFEHPDRTTVGQEGNELVLRGMVDASLIDRHLDTFNASFKENQRRLTATGFLLRRHTPSVNEFDNRWWSSFAAGRHTRDQMSVDWAAYVSLVTIGYFPGNYRKNSFARWHPHKR